MARFPRRTSPPTARRPASPPKPSLSLKLLACAISISPFLFDHSATELLHPLFSSAPTHSLATNVSFYSTLAVIFLAQKAFTTSSWSGRTYWLIIGIWKIVSEGLIKSNGDRLLSLGLDKGVLAGRLMLEAIPLLATANWIWDQQSCRDVRQTSALGPVGSADSSFLEKQRSQFLPKWFIPLSWLVSIAPKPQLVATNLFSKVPSCYIVSDRFRSPSKTRKR
jgi:hypothetical protein